MLKRKVYQEHFKMERNTEGKALCIIGARQVWQDNSDQGIWKK